MTPVPPRGHFEGLIGSSDDQCTPIPVSDLPIGFIKQHVNIMNSVVNIFIDFSILGDTTELVHHIHLLISLQIYFHLKDYPLWMVNN